MKTSSRPIHSHPLEGVGDEWDMKKKSKPVFKLFHGPGLKLWKKWRCPGCGAYMTEPAFKRTVKEWKADPFCNKCKATT